jgi:hypothetical protein
VSLCAQKHGGAALTAGKTCEDCKQARAQYAAAGPAAEAAAVAGAHIQRGTRQGLLRWCTDCAAAHPGALNDGLLPLCTVGFALDMDSSYKRERARINRMALV